MAKARGDFTDILLRKKIIGPDQLDEAEHLASSTGIKLQDALVKLELRHPGRGDGGDRRVPQPAVRGPGRGGDPQGGHRTRPRVGRPRERRPAAVARRERPQDHHRRPDQLRHHPEAPVHSEQGHPAGPGRSRSRSSEAINRNYGQTETESVDSMLVEFTDTAIEFTQTEASEARRPPTTIRTPRSSSCAT